MNSVLLGDCSEELKKISDSSIDLIAIDPPYEIRYHDEQWDNKTLNWHSLFIEFERILKDTGNLIIFQGWSNVCQTIDIGKSWFELKNWIIYDRIKGRGALTNMVSTREDVLWFIKSDKYTYNKIYSNIPKKTKGMGAKNGQVNRALTNVWSDISPIVPWSQERVDHPTQKPVQLMERIIKIWSDENNIILDCFAGSGSTGVAAQNLNRNYILIEKEEKYYNTCLQRLEKYEKQK